MDRSGGDARRLTSDVGIEIDPMFSPDGSMIAFTGEYDGNEDVYVIPAAGGIPKRLTSHPGPDQVVGWTRDGKRVLFRSARQLFRIHAVVHRQPLPADLPERLPLPMAERRIVLAGQFAPRVCSLHEFPRIVAVPARTEALSRRHRFTDLDCEARRFQRREGPRKDSNDSSPMWLGNKVYFLSDRDGPVNLYVYDTGTKQVSEALQSNGTDIKSASAGPDAIVYEQFGSIHLFDPASGKQHAVNIRVTGDFPAVRPHFVAAGDQIENADISPTGARAVFEAHGEILTVPVEHGDIRNLTNTPGVADRDPAWSPDGKWIAYFSDESGEYALHLRSQDGMGEVRKISLGNPPSFFYSPTWSPDSKKIAYSDKRLNLWYVDIDAGKPVLVDTNPYDGQLQPGLVAGQPLDRLHAPAR